MADILAQQQPMSLSFKPCNHQHQLNKVKINLIQLRNPHTQEDLFSTDKMITPPDAGAQSKNPNPRKRKRTPEVPSPSDSLHSQSSHSDPNIVSPNESTKVQQLDETAGWTTKLYKVRNGKLRSMGSKKMPKKWNVVKPIVQSDELEKLECVQEDDEVEIFVVEESEDSEAGKGFAEFGYR